MNNESEKIDEEKKDNKKIIIGIIILLIIISIVGIFIFKASEKLTENDFELKTNSTLTEILVEITPTAYDIKSITYTISIRDEQGKILNEKTYTQSNLTANQTYQYSHKIEANLFKAYDFKVTFVKGKKSIF